MLKFWCLSYWEIISVQNQVTETYSLKIGDILGISVSYVLERFQNVLDV